MDRRGNREYANKIATLTEVLKLVEATPKQVSASLLKDSED